MNFTYIPYNRSYYSYVFESIRLLQQHEYALSDSRVPGSDEVVEACLKDLQKDCRDKDGKILVGLVDGIYAGFVAYCFESSNNHHEVADYKRYALITNICVHPDFRHQGVGQKLLQSAQDEILKTGFKGRLRVWALAGNDLATSAYTRFGFRSHEVVFEKNLNKVLSHEA